MDPDRGVLLNELQWDPATDPLALAAASDRLRDAGRAGVPVTQIGNPEFSGSGLTTAALRGGDFVGAKRLHDRVDVAVDVLRERRSGAGLPVLG